MHPTDDLGAEPDGYALQTGTPITLSPSGVGSVLCLAEVLAWSVSPSGLVVTARARTDPASADLLDNRSVFISGRSSDDALVVLEAVARHSATGRGVLDLVSVAGLAREHRRAAVRAAVAVPVMVSETRPTDSAPKTVSGDTIDLSGDGCRVRLDAPRPLSVGTNVRTVLQLNPDTAIELTGVVIRSAASQSEIIVSFDPMTIEASAAIDATVYAALRG